MVALGNGPWHFKEGEKTWLNWRQQTEEEEEAEARRGVRRQAQAATIYGVRAELGWAERARGRGWESQAAEAPRELRYFSPSQTGGRVMPLVPPR